MPLTAKGEEILAKMKKSYGTETGKRVFYASRNKGTITGVDAAADVDLDELESLLTEFFEEEKNEEAHADAEPPKGYRVWYEEEEGWIAVNPNGREFRKKFDTRDEAIKACERDSSRADRAVPNKRERLAALEKELAEFDAPKRHNQKEDLEAMIIQLKRELKEGYDSADAVQSENFKAALRKIRNNHDDAREYDVQEWMSAFSVTREEAVELYKRSHDGEAPHPSQLRGDAEKMWRVRVVWDDGSVFVNVHASSRSQAIEKAKQEIIEHRESNDKPAKELKTQEAYELQDSERADHAFMYEQIGPYKILEGAGVDGGYWFAKGKGETVRFKTKEEAIEHAHISTNFEDADVLDELTRLQKQSEEISKELNRSARAGDKSRNEKALAALKEAQTVLTKYFNENKAAIISARSKTDADDSLRMSYIKTKLSGDPKSAKWQNELKKQEEWEKANPGKAAKPDPVAFKAEIERTVAAWEKANPGRKYPYSRGDEHEHYAQKADAEEKLDAAVAKIDDFRTKRKIDTILHGVRAMHRRLRSQG